ncbi:MAG: tyrosine-type recombinase/integrase [Bacteroidales bacterium]
MKATKITHSNEARIRIDFPYKGEIAMRLKQIPDARWSKSIGAWHIPYTKEAFAHLKSMFPDVEYEKSAGTAPNIVLTPQTKINIQEPRQTTNSDNPTNLKTTQANYTVIVIEIYPRTIFIKLPKNETDIQFIRSFKYAKWLKEQYLWSIPNFDRNLALLKSYFTGRKVHLVEHTIDIQPSNPTTENTNPQPTFTKDDLLVVNHSNRLLKLYFSYNRELSQQLKQIPYCSWNSSLRCWEIPYSEKFLIEIKQIAEQFKLNFTYQEEQKQKIQPRKSKFDIKNYRACPANYIDKLKELRYSQNTLAVYTDLFEEFINYYEDHAIDDITETMIIDYLRYLVNVRKISTSYQNQSINAIKFYYERVMRGSRKVYTIDRPREETYLPEVLSEQEITAILNATENLKHKAILMTIYSAGLRIGEVINLRIKDIDSQRMQIRVEQGKGKKDRYTLLSVKTLEILRKYFLQYKPKIWIFEGINGEQYSSSSIKSILRTSINKTTIKKHVTVHTLRHSFATHLLESGTDLRYIQSLLGHENSKTTEIYTHITTKGFEQIKSPLDKLELK